MDYQFVQDIYLDHPYYTIYDYMTELELDFDQTYQILQHCGVLPYVTPVETKEEKIAYIMKYSKSFTRAMLEKSLNTNQKHLEYIFKRKNLNLKDYVITEKEYREYVIYNHIMNKNDETLNVLDITEELKSDSKTVRRVIKNYGLEDRFKLNTGERVAQFINENPDKYTYREIGDFLGISRKTVNTWALRLGLQDKVLTNSLNRDTKRQNRVVKLIKDNPNVYTRKEIVEILDETEEYIDGVVYRKKLVDLVRDGRRDREGRVSERINRCLSFVEENPNQYTYKEISQVLDEDEEYVRCACNRYGINNLVVRVM